MSFMNQQYLDEKWKINCPISNNQNCQAKTYQTNTINNCKYKYHKVISARYEHNTLNITYLFF